MLEGRSLAKKQGDLDVTATVRVDCVIEKVEFLGMGTKYGMDMMVGAG